MTNTIEKGTHEVTFSCQICSESVTYTKKGSPSRWIRRYCDDCAKSKNDADIKSHYERNREEVIQKQWVHNIRTHFGLTPEQYQDMLDSHQGNCWSCGEPERSTRYGKVIRLAIDHSHDTGVVRGLLCKDDNVLLGSCGDTLEGLQLALSKVKRDSVRARLESLVQYMRRVQ